MVISEREIYAIMIIIIALDANSAPQPGPSLTVRYGTIAGAAGRS